MSDVEDERARIDALAVRVAHERGCSCDGARNCGCWNRALALIRSDMTALPPKAEPTECPECHGRGVPDGNPQLLWCSRCGKAAFDPPALPPDEKNR